MVVENGIQLRITVSIFLKVRFGFYRVKNYLLVCDALQLDFILVTLFIYRHVANTHAQDSFLKLLDRTEFPIIRSFMCNLADNTVKLPRELEQIKRK